MKKSFLDCCKLAATALFAVFGLASCFQMESVMSLNADGSGTITNKLLLSAQMKAMMAQQPNKEAQISEESIRKSAEKMGATLKSYKEIEEDGFSGAESVLEFADVNKIKLNAQGAETDEEQNPITFNFTPGTPAKLTITFPASGSDPAVPVDNAQAQAQLAMIKPMLVGAKVKMTLKAGSEIVKTNATHVEGNEVTLLEMNIEEAFSDPAMIQKASGMKHGGPFGPAYQDIKGIKSEANESLDIEFK